MTFKKKLKFRLYTAITYLLAGIIMAALFLLRINKNEFIFTFGIVLATMGLLRLISYKKITKNDESVHQQEIAEKDERNIAIMHKAKSMAFGIYVFTAAIAVIIFQFLGKNDLCNIIAINMCAIVFLYWICYFIFQKNI